MISEERARQAVGEQDRPSRLAHHVEGRTRDRSAEQEAEMHHRAHEECYIANSVKSEVVVQGAMSFA